MPNRKTENNGSGQVKSRRAQADEVGTMDEAGNATNLPPLKAVARQFTLLCRKLELFGGELLAIDGSKFTAVNDEK